MMDVIFVALIIIHVIAVIAWVGFAMFFEIVVESHKKQAVLFHAGPRLTGYMIAASLTTIIVGFVMFAYLYATHNMSELGNGTLVIELGAVVGVIAWLFGMYLGMETAKLGASGPETASAPARLKELEWISRTELILLIITVGLMVLGSSM